MNAITKVSLFLVVLLVSYDANAIFAPRQEPMPKTSSIKQPRKLKLKERAALWMLKRKIKKLQKKQRNAVLSDSIRCERIILKSGDTIEVKITKVSLMDVQFVRCGADDASVLMISKADIEKICLSDGAVIYQNTDANRRKTRQNNSLKVVLLVILVLVLAPIITIGIIASELNSSF